MKAQFLFFTKKKHNLFHQTIIAKQLLLFSKISNTSKPHGEYKLNCFICGNKSSPMEESHLKWSKPMCSMYITTGLFLYTLSILKCCRIRLSLKTISNIEPFANILVAIRLAEGTIRNSYKDFYPHLSKIKPTYGKS